MKFSIEVDGIDELYALRALLNRLPVQVPPGAGIESLDLSVRELNCLRAEGIFTLDQLISKTSNELLKTPNIGRRSLDTIRTQLKSIGLHLLNDEHFQPRT